MTEGLVSIDVKYIKSGMIRIMSSNGTRDPGKNKLKIAKIEKVNNWWFISIIHARIVLFDIIKIWYHGRREHGYLVFATPAESCNINYSKG